MAVFRAGPWGTPSDPYQPRPDVVSGRRDIGDPDIGVYPINVANNVFGWRSFYSVQKQECATPASLDVIWPVTYNFGSTITYVSKTILRGTYDPLTAEVVDQRADLCYYGYAQYPGGYNFPDYQGEVFTLYWNGSSWQCYFGNEYFAQQDSQTLDSIDGIDPTGITTISGTAYYDGYTITVIDPTVINPNA